MKMVSQNVPFAQGPRSENSQSFGVSAETVNGRERKQKGGRPRRHRADRLPPDASSRRNRTFDEATHNPDLPVPLPASMREVSDAALDRAQLIHGMSETDRLYASVIVSACYDERAGRVAWLSQKQILERLRKHLTEMRRPCAISSVVEESAIGVR